MSNYRRIRLLLVLLSLVLFIFTFLMGTLTRLSMDEAQTILQEFEETLGTRPGVTTIIMNNITFCLLFFIPVFGTFYLAYAGYSTGTVLSAVATLSANSANALVLFLLTLLFPWAWMEFAAYSLASSEGIMFVLSILGRGLRRELRNLAFALGASVALIIVGGLVEAIAVSTFLSI